MTILERIERRKQAILRKHSMRGDFIGKIGVRNHPPFLMHDRVKALAQARAAENRAFNEGRPQHEHRVTSVRKIRKQLRNADLDNLPTIQRAA